VSADALSALESASAGTLRTRLVDASGRVGRAKLHLLGLQNFGWDRQDASSSTICLLSPRRPIGSTTYWCTAKSGGWISQHHVPVEASFFPDGSAIPSLDEIKATVERMEARYCDSPYLPYIGVSPRVSTKT